MAAKITTICDQLSEQIARKQALLEQYRQGHKELNSEIRDIKKKIKSDWKEWRAAVKLVSKSVALKS